MKHGGTMRCRNTVQTPGAALSALEGLHQTVTGETAPVLEHYYLGVLVKAAGLKSRLPHLLPSTLLRFGLK